jgi:hypothetical protein
MLTVKNWLYCKIAPKTVTNNHERTVLMVLIIIQKGLIVKSTEVNFMIFFKFCTPIGKMPNQKLILISHKQSHETSQFWREQHNDIKFIWWLTECQINFCCCCYFWRGGCDWLKIFAILNSGNLDFVNFLSILRKLLHAEEKSKALYCVFDDDNHHCSCIW